MSEGVAIRKTEPEMCSQWWALPWGVLLLLATSLLDLHED